ncbi:STAS domain-containing protein [Leisingera caerulea]|uniref:STAS domain-containing protein n=1 Tax=Leisingera caerulea TaxID=506591 RepID=A0A9Q9HJC5_LEICA|nr:STAS domain-containing protein [Leisingera caerulea]UWQ49096.1 STAS domain-containing protein [Leisingera caerulea]UWQ53217.1 STAS domain-containing protein [Leisingera caerulea]UWQ57734.1 STAS domain-containing protein [Leisingera caerulea]
MSNTATATVLAILEEEFQAVHEAWLGTQGEEGLKRTDLFSDSEGREHTVALLQSFAKGVRNGVIGEDFDLDGAAWSELRNVLADLTKERVRRGVTPTEMASFVFALKPALFERMRQRKAHDPSTLIEEVWLISRVIDAFALYTNEIFIAEREQVIERQREEMLELSTPVVELWDRVLTLPLIGTLDSARAQDVMENLLEAIMRERAEVVIVDITGVQVVDTQVAQHLLRTASAVRLMGAECIISGISPKIAQTMVQLGVDVGNVTTRSTIRRAIGDALDRLGYQITAKDA